MEHWNLNRVVAHPIRVLPGLRRPSEPGADPARLLRDNPVLLLSGPRADASVDTLLRLWNPTPTRDEQGVLHVADSVRWFGPYPLDPVLSAEAELPSGWSIAYAAQAPRRRTRVPDGLDAAELRRRFPRDIPAGPEAAAWALVAGLARHLGGAARLPACPPRSAEPEEVVYCVYGHEALPWQVLRSVLELAVPDLNRNGALAPNEYCLEQSGRIEVGVRPFGDADFLPYALRSRADDGWPHTVYRFNALRQENRAQTIALVDRLHQAAQMLAEVVGGVLLDAEGFPSRVAV